VLLLLLFLLLLLLLLLLLSPDRHRAFPLHLLFSLLGHQC
jgi:hypothetical protein